MYEQIVILLSFVFAIAMTHLLSSATELVLARDRLIFSGLQALWMLNALLCLVISWLFIPLLRELQHWTPGDLILNLAQALVQYFTCSLLAMRVAEKGPVDMGAFFDRQRKAIMTAFAALLFLAGLDNYRYAESAGNPSPLGCTRMRLFW